MFVVLQTAFLGDTILTTPLIEYLAARGPVHVVATPAGASLLANNPGVASLIVYDKRGADAGVSGLRRVAARVRATGAQTAYIAQGSLRTAALALVAGVRERVGFSSSPGRVLYTRRVAFRRDLHHAQRLLMLARAPGLVPPALAVRPSLFPGDREEAEVDALLHSHGVTQAEPLVALAPGSVWATKRWPSYDALAQRLAEIPAMHGARVTIIGGAAAAPLATAISKALAVMGAAPAVDATGHLSLLASAALIGRARVLVTNDSAPLHMASAMNTPTIAIYGPTVPAFGFGPLAEVHAVIGHEGLACRPCDAHGPKRCPLGHWRCMRELEPERVAAAVEAMM